MKKYPVDELIRVVKNDPTGTHKAWRDSFAEECADAFREEFFDFWYRENISRIVVKRRADGSYSVKTVARGSVRKSRPRTAGDRAAAVKRAKALADAVSKTVLMDLRTSTGKKLRDCTFGELKKEAGWLSALADGRNPKDIVGEHLTEADLFNVRMRNVG